MISRRIYLLGIVSVLLGLVVACNFQPQTVPVIETVVVEKVNTVTAAASPADRVRLDLHIRTDPPSLDPALAADTTSHFFINQMFIGLTTFDEKANVISALATTWEVSKDGREWTFHLRDDVHWVRRDPKTGEIEDLGIVTAQDVVYGVTRTLDPRTASPYAYVLYLIDGAEALNKADPNSKDFKELLTNLGVSAPDNTTVLFKLKQPAAYLPAITGMRMAYPQPRAAIEQGKDQWTEPGSIVTNGPYTLAEWNHSASLLLEKNPRWIKANEVQIDLIGGPIIQEASTAMAMYEKNELDMVADPPGWEPPLADMDRIRSDPQLSREYFTAPRLCTDFIGFVNTKPPFDKPLVRKAFAAAINRVNLVNNVTKGGQVPAHSFAPPGIFGNVADNMSIGSYLVESNYADQMAQARTWLAEAGYPEGKGIDIILGHDTAEGQTQLAQAIQAMWQEVFPQAKITIESQEWGAYLDTLMPGSPDKEKPHTFRLGGCSDYPDQNDWLPLFKSESGMNFVKYDNAKYDTLVETAAYETNLTKRLDLYRQAEEIFINQDTALAPLYYYTYNRLYKPWLTKVVINPVGGGDPVAQWKIDWAAKKAARGE